MSSHGKRHRGDGHMGGLGRGRGGGSERGHYRGGGGGGRGGFGRGGGRGRGADVDAYTHARERQPTELLDIKEADFGISAYSNPEVPGFFGILKQRYSDFVVHEITEDGQVVRVDSFDVPDEPYISGGRSEAEWRQRLVEIVGEEAVVAAEAVAAGTRQEAVVVGPFAEKPLRSEVHQAVKNLFPQLSSSTVEEGRIEIGIPGTGGARVPVQRQTWPSQRPKFLLFHLYKENRDSFEALNVLGKLVRMNPRSFAVAGTKDKRGITVQRVTAFMLPAERLLSVQLYGMMVGNCRYVSEALRLGQLMGNRFEVVLRNIDCSEEHALRAVRALSETGFINYYGLQRFGTGEVGTHVVGTALLRGEWQKAVGLLLQPGARRVARVNAALEQFARGGNAEAALSVLPAALVTERTLLLALSELGARNYVEALLRLPRNLRMMYLHAFQSYVWNRVVTERIRRHGLRPVAGDLVMDRVVPAKEADKVDADVAEPDGAVAAAAAAAMGELDDQQVGSKRKADAREPTGDADAGAEAAAAAAETEEVEDVRGSVRVLSAVEATVASMEDVVLPLPGFDVRLPENDTAETYKALYAELGVTPDSFSSRVRSQFSLPGAYRRVLVKPKDFEWALLRYNDPDQPLVATDRSRLEGLPEPQSIPDGRMLALRIAFSLPSSAYATMLIRELMKCETSAMVHAARNTAPPAAAAGAGASDATNTGAADDSAGAAATAAGGDASVDGEGKTVSMEA